MPNFYWNISNIPTLNVQNGLTVGYGTCTGSWITQDTAVYDTLSVHGSGAGSPTNYKYYWDSTSSYNSASAFFGVQSGTQQFNIAVTSASEVSIGLVGSLDFPTGVMPIDDLAQGMQSVTSSLLGAGASYTPGTGPWYMGGNGALTWAYNGSTLAVGNVWGLIVSDGYFTVTNNTTASVELYYSFPI